jgi:enamine deaminase RidA (YjgF/YER057c/UK114 family)
VRETYKDGGGFEEAAAYSRAVRAGNQVVVSGTAALDAEGNILFPGDCGAQAREAIRRALDGAARLGGRREDVIRTRLLLAPGADWRQAVAAHRDAFAGVDPANTTYFAAGFVGEGVLVEVELEAVVPDSPPR